MSITIELKPEIEARMKAEAAARGIPVSAYAQTLIEQALLPVNQKEVPAPHERARAFREWAESHSRETPPLSDFAVSRESIYEDEGA
ncbi:MAG: hypothetical protein NZT92_06455 [Abditibacteriales bacterium]|nr:hypothetical protein [Abditibacteriales bacterium]MDW8365700.1 hypothetical protein [Abditibacteriales bacterium]